MLLEKVLERSFKQSVFTYKPYRQKIEGWGKEPVYRQFEFKIRTDLDFFKFEIIENGMINKRTFETIYDTVRNNHFDMWDYIDFKQRKQLIDLVLLPATKEMLSFTVADQRIYIPFFSPLINSLYEKEMPVFELPQFLKMYTDFKKELVDLQTYGFLPYLAHFCDCLCIYAKDDVMVLYSEAMNVFYRVGPKPLRLPMDSARFAGTTGQLVMMLDFILRDDQVGIINYLCNCDYVDEAVKKRLIHLRTHSEKNGLISHV